MNQIARLRTFLLLAGLPALLVSCEKNGSDSSAETKPQHSASSAKLHPAGPAEIVTKSGVEMVYVAGGEFLMGSNQGNADEAPPHRVKLSGFLMDKFEVTHEMWTKAQLPNPSHWQD